MFDVSSSEFLVILAVAAIVIGPKDMPVVAKKVGKVIVKFKRASRDFMKTLEEAAEETGIKDAIDEINREGVKLNTIVDLDGNERHAYDVGAMERELGIKPRVKPAPKKTTQSKSKKTRTKPKKKKA
ncbi:MAG: hypothetical protein EB060_09865 [Proteobacteria bacterium]|nr:hypothetical protein [Pseudomonadota bacterium]